MDKFISLTNQFKYCPNAFKVDTYEGCDFGCKYCFANCRGGGFASQRKNEAISIEYMTKFFCKAFETDADTRNITVELMRHRVPFHLGGMSDPFQSREFKEKRTYEFLRLTNKYSYPVMISTKTAHLDQEYWDVLNPSIHAFQISICGLSDDFIRKYEANTPTAHQRIEFIKELKQKGFWVSVRIQPVIDINEALLLTNEIKDIVDYITVEHIKVATDNFNVRDLFKEQLDTLPFTKPKKSRNYELATKYKLKNVMLIKKIAKCKVGCADNDLHKFSDSSCCCGIDCINNNFSNYLRYNTCYFDYCNAHGIPINKEDIYIPKCSCRKCMNGDYVKDGLYKINEYVDCYIKETTGSPYKIKAPTLLKEICYWYGDYEERDGFYIFNDGSEEFKYNSVEEALKDFLPTLLEDSDTDWSEEIKFIQSLK